MVLIDLHYLPSLEFFCALIPHETVFVERHEHFVKQSYRNRCYINTSQGPQMLTVPVTGHGKIAMGELKIDYSQRWSIIHWRAIEAAYRKAPFFEHYESRLRGILLSSKPTLFDLNLELLSFCLASLKWEKQVIPTEDFKTDIPMAVNDLRSVIEAKKTYMDRNFYRPLPYYQVFGSTFVENLSILDLLFCAGPQASALLRSSVKEMNN